MADEVVQERARNFVEQGQAAARAGQRELARRYLQAAVDIDPDNVTAWLWLAGVQEDPHNVKRSLEKVLEIEPNNKRARQGLRLIEDELAEEAERAPVEPEASEESSQSIEQALRAQLRQSSEGGDGGGRSGQPALREPSIEAESAGISFGEMFSDEDILYRAITLALLGLLVIGIIMFVLLLLGIVAPIA